MISNAPFMPADPSERFAMIFRALQRSVADNGYRLKIHGPLLVLIWNYLSRQIARFAKIAAKPPQSPRAPSTVERKPTTKPKPALTLPRGFAWLIRLLPNGPAAPIVAGATARGDLQLFMEDPIVQALLATHPSLGRILRPLHTMLGLRYPPSIKRPRKHTSSTKPRPKRIRKPKRQPSFMDQYKINPDGSIDFTQDQLHEILGPPPPPVPPWHQPFIPSFNVKKLWRRGP
jgi:hypothetical protein